MRCESVPRRVASSLPVVQYRVGRGVAASIMPGWGLFCGGGDSKRSLHPAYSIMMRLLHGMDVDRWAAIPVCPQPGSQWTVSQMSWSSGILKGLRQCVPLLVDWYPSLCDLDALLCGGSKTVFSVRNAYRAWLGDGESVASSTAMPLIAHPPTVRKWMKHVRRRIQHRHAGHEDGIEEDRVRAERQFLRFYRSTSSYVSNVAVTAGSRVPMVACLQ